MAWVQGEHLWLKESREGKGPILVVRRKLGNAVKRNRLKRRLRCIMRPTPAAGRDLVVLARNGATDVSYAVLHEELLRLLEQLEKRYPR